MATVFEYISLKGIRRADLQALSWILDNHIQSGEYWGNKEEFDGRMKRLKTWLDNAVDYAYSEGVKMPRVPK